MERERGRRVSEGCVVLLKEQWRLIRHLTCDRSTQFQVVRISLVQTTLFSCYIGRVWMASKPRRRLPRHTCGTPREPNAAATLCRMFGARRSLQFKTRAPARQ